MLDFYYKAYDGNMDIPERLEKTPPATPKEESERDSDELSDLMSLTSKDLGSGLALDRRDKKQSLKLKGNQATSS